MFSTRFLQRGGGAIIGPETIGADEVDSVRAVERRLTLDVAGHYHRPAVFQFVVNRRPWGGGPTAGVTHS